MEVEHEGDRRAHHTSIRVCAYPLADLQVLPAEGTELRRPDLEFVGRELRCLAAHDAVPAEVAAEEQPPVQAEGASLVRAEPVPVPEAPTKDCGCR